MKKVTVVLEFIERGEVIYAMLCDGYMSRRKIYCRHDNGIDAAIYFSVSKVESFDTTGHWSGLNEGEIIRTVQVESPLFMDDPKIKFGIPDGIF